MLAGYFPQLAINPLCILYLESYAFSNHFQVNILMGVNFDKQMKDFMQDLSSKHIIPHMEQKVRVLNQQVSLT